MLRMRAKIIEMAERLACLSFFLMSALACNPAVQPLSLYLNLAEGPAGDGSECQPFRAFDEALYRAAACPVAEVVFIHSPAVATAQFAIATEVTLQGNGAVLLLRSPIQVSASGVFTLRNLTIEATSEYALESSGTIAFSAVASASLSIEIAAGVLAISESHFVSPWLTILDSGAKVTLTDSSFQGTDKAFIEVYASASSKAGALIIDGCSVTEVRGLIIAVLSAPTSLLSITVRNSAIRDCGTFIGGKAQNVNLEVTNSRFLSMKHVMTGSADHASFADCSFAYLSDPPFLLDSLRGTLAVSGSAIHDLAVGPAFLIPSNPFPSALLSLSSSQVYSVANPNYQFSGAVLYVTCVTVHLSDTEVYGVSALKSGLMSVTLGVVLLTNVLYRDSAVSITCFMDGALSDISLRNVTMARVENNDGAVMTTLFACTGYWDQVAVVDSIDTRIAQYRDYIVFWVGFSGNYTIKNSYIRNAGQTLISMAATSDGFLTILNTTYENMDAVRVFDMFLGGRIHLIDVTFVNARAVMVMNCAQEQFCARIQNLKFTGKSAVLSLFSLAPGQAELVDTVLDSVSIAIFYVMIQGSAAVSNVTVQNSQFVFCRDCIDSAANVSDFRAVDVQTDTMFQLTLTALRLTRCSLTRVSATQLFSMISATVVATDLTIEDSDVNSLGGLFAAEGNSVIALDYCHMAELHCRLAMSAGLIAVTDSELRLEHTSASKFNATLILSVGSRVTIDSCSFVQGGLDEGESHQMKISGGVLRDESSTALSISNTLFEGIAGSAGGAVSFFSARKPPPTYSITDSDFRSCRSLEFGGGIRGASVILSVSGCTFQGNIAQRGGALWLIRSDATVSNSRFLNNTADLDGGAIQYIEKILAAPDTVFEHNTAVYGPDFAMEVRHVYVIDTDTRLPIKNYTALAASGQRLPQKILLGLYDDMDQLVVTDNSSQLVLSAAAGNQSLEGSTMLYPDQGVYTILNLAVVAEPLTVVDVFATMKSVSERAFTVALRRCKMGEFYTNSRCRLCTNNMYSFDPAVPCKLCPREATCTEGYKMNLSPGYWRSSPIDETLHKCIVPELCVGGVDSVCTPGSRGVMCNECSSDYFKLNQLQCFACKNTGASVTKGVLTLSAALIAIVASLYSSESMHMVHAVAFDYFHIIRILANLNMFWPDSLGYLLVVLGDIGSVGLTSFTDLCLGSASDVQPVYFQLFMSFTYFIVVSVAVGCCGFLAAKVCPRTFTPSQALELLFVTSYLMLPLLFMRAMQFFPCYYVDGSRRLIFDPAVECWTVAHKKYAFGIALPVVVLCILFSVVLLARTLPAARFFFPKMPRWKALHLAVFQLRSYAITSVLVVSQALELSSQTGITILIALATELALYNDLESYYMYFASLYSSTLTSTILFVFWCVIYNSQRSELADWREPVFVFMCYLGLSVPILYGLALYWWKRRKSHPVSPALPPSPQECLRVQSPLQVAAEVAEDDDSYRSNRGLVAPLSSPAALAETSSNDPSGLSPK